MRANTSSAAASIATSILSSPIPCTSIGAGRLSPIRKCPPKVAVVNVKTEVVNDSGSEKSASVRQQILDPDGKVVAEFSSSKSIAAGATAEFDMPSPSFKNPLLWHPDRPYLYVLKTTVLEADRVTDEYSTTFGIRTFKWTADKGFFLNGEHLYILGANVHQDQAGWGDAVTEASMERDLKMMKQAGFNFIRGSHYPHSPKFSELCDRLGLLFWSENAYWSTAMGQPEGYWNGSGYPTRAEDQPEFEASVKAQLTEMIRIHRNHPSIVAWSMCNEPFFSADSVMPKVRTFLADLVDLSHKLDPTRPAALGGVQRPTNQNRIDKIGDIAGYNGDGAGIAIFQNPGVPNIVSEYNVTTTDRPGKYDPNWGDLARDRGQPVHEWRSGQVIWCGFDHGSLFGARFGKMGIVDYFRIPKRLLALVPKRIWQSAASDLARIRRARRFRVGSRQIREYPHRRNGRRLAARHGARRGRKTNQQRAAGRNRNCERPGRITHGPEHFLRERQRYSHPRWPGGNHRPLLLRG